MNRSRLLLTVLVGILVLSLAYAFWAMPRQEKAPHPAQPALSAAKRAAAGKAAPSTDRLQLGLLAQVPQPFPGADRDIFRFRSGRIASPDELPVSLVPPVKVEPPPPPPPPPPTPEELLRAETSRLTFLGFLNKGGVKSVFLSEGGELFVVKSGEVFGRNKSLVAREINEKQLVVGWNRGPETVRINLIEGDAHKPAVLGAGSAARNPAQRSPATGLRPGRMSPSRRIAPPQEIVQPELSSESPEEGSQLDNPQEEKPFQPDGQEGGHPPENGVKPGELTNGKLPSGEGNGTKQ